MFLSRLELIAADQPDYWYVAAPLVWCDPTYGRIEVPAGFRTDLASYPRILRNLPCFDVAGPSRRPAIVHDMLYRLERGAGKARADAFLRAALISEGVSPACAAMTYYGVHWFGGPSWAGDGATAVSPVDFATWDQFAAWACSRGGTLDG